MTTRTAPSAQSKSRPTGPAQTGKEARDPVWQKMRKEADSAMAAEPALTGFIFATITSHDRLEDAICHRISQRLAHADLDAGLLIQTFNGVLASQPDVIACIRADLAAVLDRDPACNRYIEPVLFFKGFHALVTHRFAHELWRQGRTDFALYLQSQSSKIFATDIHPAARFGRGIMLDHATGFVPACCDPRR
jgi:serine O-acetyltransferase